MSTAPQGIQSGERRSAPVPSNPRWNADDVKRAIGPHIETIVTEFGVKLTGKRTGKGWLECHAIDREDVRPSAGIDTETLVYNDLGGVRQTLSIFDLAVEMKAFPDFFTAVNSLGERYNVAPSAIPVGGKSKPPRPIPVPRTVSAPVADSKPRTRKNRIGYRTFEEAAKKVAWSLKGKMVADWTFHRADGSEAFRVARFEGPEGKTYRPFRFDPSSLWISGDPDGLLPLYRLPELSEPGPVFILEGEKVADLARRQGLTATTSAHGAKSASKSDWAPLAGREVVIVPDNDKAGEGYATEVIKQLRQIEPRPSVRVLNLPDLGEGEDLEQWLERVPDGWDEVRCGQELRRLALKAIDPTKPKPASDEILGMTDLSTVTPREVVWMWKNRIPEGKITLFAGEGGLGKSFLTCYMASVISRGSTWPDDPGNPVPAGDVVFLNAEDGLDDTIVPRLIAMGADLKRCVSLGTAILPNGKREPFTLDDIDRLEQVMLSRPGIKMIVIDPITAFLGRGVDDNKNADLRRILGPLSEFADKYNVSIVAITHLSKNSNANAAGKIIGSVAYSNAARATWAVVMDPQDEGRRLFLPVKNNLSPDRSGMAYTIVDGKLVWEIDPINVNVNDVMGGKEAKPKLAKKEKLADFLREELKDGPQPSNNLMAKAVAAGFSKNSVFGIKDELGIRATKKGFGAAGVWVWELPPSEAAGPGGPDGKGQDDDPIIGITFD